MKCQIKGNLNLSSNYLLKDLKGLPEEIGGTLDIRYCISLSSLDHGLGKKIKIGKKFLCDNRFSEEEVRKYFDVDGELLFYLVNYNDLLLMFVRHSDNVDKEAVELLLEKGADINMQGVSGVTALIYVTMDGNKDLVKFLLEKGAKVNLRDGSGKTALMIASINGHKEIVELLLEKGANVNLKDIIGWTALKYAAHSPKKEIAELLKKYGAK